MANVRTRFAPSPHPAGKTEPLRQPPCRLGKLEFVEILIGHIVVLDLPGGFHIFLIAFNVFRDGID